MSFKDDLADDLENVFYNTDEFAESVSYTAYGYWPKTIIAIITQGDGDEYQGSNSYAVNAMMLCTVADLATVTNKDTVALADGTAWGVVGARKVNDGLEWEIQLNKDL